MDYAIGIVFVLVVVGAWLAPGVISLMKGHIIGGVIGLVAFTPVSWVTSALIAKPDSAWARRFYGPEKMAKATQRYPAKQQAPVAATATAAEAGDDWRCKICGEVSATRVAAESHVRGSHEPAPVESSIEPVAG